MDIKTNAVYNHMSCAEFSDWGDNIDYLGIGDKLNRKKDNTMKDFMVSLQMNPTHPKDARFTSRGFDSLKDAITAMNGRTNCFQVIVKENRYLYFDIDKATEEVDLRLTETEFVEYMERFLTTINLVLKRNLSSTEDIEYKDLQIHTKTEDDHISSIHIIITKYYMDVSQLWNLVKLINAEDNNILLDTLVYTASRRFCNCFSGKIGRPIFEYHKSNVNEYSLVWIDNISSHDTEKIDFTIEPKQNVVVIDEDLISFVIHNKKKYLRNTAKWMVFMFHVKYSCSISREDFCRETLVGDKWTYEDNLLEWDNADTTYAIKDVDAMTKTIFTTRFIRNPINNKFFEYINASTELRNELRNIPTDVTSIKLNGLSFDTKSGVLTHNGKTTLYYADMYRQSIQSNVIEVSQDKVYDMVKHDKYIFINALYGGGKTHFVIAPTIMDAINKDLSVLVITENNALNKQYEADKRLQLVSHLKRVGADYQVCSLESLWKLTTKQSTIKKYDVVILDEMLSLMTHFHSNKTMRGKERPIYDAMMYFIKNCSKCVVCDADLSEHTYTDFLDRIHPNRTIYKIKVPKYQEYSYNIVFQRGKIITKIVEDLKNNLKVIVACDMKNTAKQIQQTILDTFANKNVLAVLGNETGNGYLINGVELTQEQNDYLFRDKEHDTDYDPSKKYDLCEFIELYEIDIMVYSPKIKTGVSINGEAFDKQYGIASGRSVTSREFIQMIHRARDLTDTNIWVSLPTPRTNRDLSKINAEYVEKLYGDGTRVLDAILGKDKICLDKRYGMTEILAEGCAEIRRSKECFTTEFYNSIINLGLKCIVHTQDISETKLSKIDGELTKFLSLGLPTLTEIKKLVVKLMVMKEEMTSNEKITLKYLRHLLRLEMNYSPKQNTLKRYYFNGLMDYEKLEAFFNRTNEREIYSLLDLNRIRHNREFYKYFKTLDEDEIIALHTTYMDKTTEQTALDNISKNTALYFFTRFMEIIEKDSNKLLRKTMIKFSNKDLMIINAVFKNERKKDADKIAFHNKSKIEDIMRFLSKLTLNHYGSKFIVSNNVRNAYVEIPHKRLNVYPYEPRFKPRMDAKKIDIESLPLRSALKSESTHDNFFKIRDPRRTRFTDRYASKTDKFENKLITRKMKNSPYSTPVPYWNPVEKPNPNYTEETECDCDCENCVCDSLINTTDEMICVYEREDTINKHYNVGVYEPSLTIVSELSKTIFDKTDEFLILYNDINNKPAQPTDSNTIRLYYDVMDVIDNPNYEEEWLNDFWFVSDKIVKPKKIKCSSRGNAMLRDIRIKITAKDVKPPLPNDGDTIIDIANGFGFVFENISLPLKMYHLKITHGYKFYAKFEIDFTRPYKIPNNTIDGYFIQQIYFSHLDVSVSHTLKNLEQDKSFTYRNNFKHDTHIRVIDIW